MGLAEDMTWPITKVRIGVDIGKQQDYTAIVVTEEQDRNGAPWYIVRMISRLPLGTEYLDVVQKIVDTNHRLESRSNSLRHVYRSFPTEVVIDGTGVGRPIVDLLRERRVSPKVAIFTGGDAVNERAFDEISIGKGAMVSRLQVLLKTGRLRLPVSPEASVLIEELKAYTPKVNERTRNVSFNAKSGHHDDLVIALGLSVGTGSRASVATDTSAFSISEEEAAIRAIRNRRRAS